MRIHESFRLTEGRPVKLRGTLEHYAYNDVAHHLQKINAYTTLIADQWHEEGRRTNAVAMVVHPWLAFLRNYVMRRGFTEGTVGFVISIMNAYYVFLKLAKLWEKQRSVPHRAPRAADHA
jgi:hypothetical protein